MQNNQWRLVGKSEKKSLTNNLELGILLKKFHILSTELVEESRDKEKIYQF